MKVARAVGPARDLAADEPLGVLDQAGHQRREPLGAVAARELLQRALGHGRRGDLRRRGRRASSAGSARSRGAPRTPSRPARRGRRAAARAGGCPPGRSRVLSHAAEPGSRPPTSPWCAVVVAKPTSASSRKTGWKTKMSCRWMPPSKGSFITNTSPGRIRSPHFASRCSIATGTAPRWNGTVTACATVSPSRRRARRRSPSRRARRSSARCGRSSSPSRRRSTRARCRRSAA